MFLSSLYSMGCSMSYRTDWREGFNYSNFWFKKDIKWLIEYMNLLPFYFLKQLRKKKKKKCRKRNLLWLLWMNFSLVTSSPSLLLLFIIQYLIDWLIFIWKLKIHKGFILLCFPFWISFLTFFYLFWLWNEHQFDNLFFFFFSFF